MKTFLQLILLPVFASLSVAQESKEQKSSAQNENPPANRRRAVQAQTSVIANVAEKVERDVVYGKVGDVELKMDIYFPKQSGEKAIPTVMYVHGGGWRAGDKGGGAGALAIPELLKRGYLVTSINYRLAPEF